MSMHALLKLFSLLALGFPTQLDGDRLTEIGEVLRRASQEIMATAGVATGP